MLTLRFLLFFTFKFFIIQLKSVTNSETTNPLKDYLLTCDVQCQREGMGLMPPYCTAIANSNGSAKSFLEIKQLRPSGMKFMFTINTVPYAEWRNVFSQDGRINEIVQIIKDEEVNAVAFDFMYQDNDIPFDPDFNSLICPFILKIKKEVNGILVGLWVRHYWVETAFDLPAIDKEVDFYVLKSFLYRQCREKDISTSDYRTTTDQNLADSISGLELGKFNFKKVLMTIDIVTYSYHKKKDGTATHTHVEACRDNKSRHRRFCVDTLGELYNKAKLAFSREMMGIYVMYVDYDDYLGACDCKSDEGERRYPGLKALSLGITGEGSIGNLDKCEWFGIYKRKATTFLSVF